MTLDNISFYIRVASCIVIFLIFLIKDVDVWCIISDKKTLGQDLTFFEKCFVRAHAVIVGFIVGWAWFRLLK